MQSSSRIAITQLSFWLHWFIEIHFQLRDVMCSFVLKNKHFPGPILLINGQAMRAK